MNYLLSNPVNIDIDIQRLQIAIYDALLPVWSQAANFVEIDAYGRIYRNEKDPGVVVPEIWLPSENQYREVYFDNRVSAHVFFIDGQLHTTEDQLRYETDLKICFMVNLRHLNDIAERADAQVQRDAVTAVREFRGTEFRITGIQTGIDNVFSGFETGGIKREQTDQQPLHVFSINGQFGYYRQDSCELYNT